MKIWKLLSAVLLNGILFFVIPEALAYFKLIKGLTDEARLILLVTWVGLCLKLLFGDVVSDKFEYHKHGYDFCVVTMGTALSLFSLQLIALKDNRDILPGAPTFSFLSAIAPAPINQRLVFLACLFFLSCFFSLLTARISRAVSEVNTQGKDLLSLLNFFFGSGLFGAYLFLLIAKS
jgi:putative effector of murein hydrolase LrgA (UPF0299 family)